MPVTSGRSARPAISILPRPWRVEERSGSFAVAPGTRVLYREAGDDASEGSPRSVVELFARGLASATGLPIGTSSDDARRPGDVALRLSEPNGDLGPEGYVLEVAKDGVTVSAPRTAGLFYGIQSLLQLLPCNAAGARQVPCVRITDRPRFPWRGMHLDVSRHFFPTDAVKRYLDTLAMHRMNVFHWHLTDDQGFRLEIGRYPRLAEVGAWRADREDQHWLRRDPQREGEKPTYGGFYTRGDVKQIVSYARDRGITVVPEIEMPAHAMAALAAYPEYSCNGAPIAVPPGSVWPITQIFCAGNDGTFRFLEGILEEVLELFPSPWIHIGGDEADKKEWRACPKCQERIRREGLRDENELQSWFVKRIECFLNAMGRRLIGWDEILEGGLAPRAAVMSWRGMEGGIEAARAGHDVVMTPGTHCYFDHYQGDPKREPLAIGGFTTVRKVFEFEPVPAELTPEEAAHVLGAQGNVWTEYMPDIRHVEYMVLPRAAALSEVLWSPKEPRDWPDFERRLARQIERYEAEGYNYARSPWEASRYDVAGETKEA
jgi:hexosaminidase